MSRSPQPSPPATGTTVAVTGWDMVLVTLLLLRLFVPAESAHQGTTLWVATLIFAGWALRNWWLWRIGEFSHPLRLAPAQLGVALLVGGHLLSGLLVLWLGGDRRAALNLSWEWLSMGALWLLLAERFRSPAFRQLAGTTLGASVLVLAGLGIWQCWVEFPQTGVAIERLIELESSSRTGGTLSESEQAELKQLLQRYPEVAGQDATAQQLLLGRVRHVQPLGRFALANTLAGLLLLGGLIGWSGWLTRAWTLPRQRMVLLLTGAALILILGTLWETDSRTAQVAGLLGLTVITVGEFWLRSAGAPAHRQHVRTILLAVAVLSIGLIGGLLLFAPQLLQAPLLSLRYRLEYWQATAQLLFDHPLFGSGLGNFRQLYLQYKLPGSSEEVLDPHNLVLDVWANGGLLALAGLVVLTATILWHGWRSWIRLLPAAPAPVPHLLSWRSTAGCVTAAVAIVGCQDWLLQGEFDPRLWGLLPAGLLAGGLAGGWSAAAGWSWAIGWWALSLHLCGAGGIGMPAILCWWLAALGLGLTAQPDESPSPVTAATSLTSAGRLLRAQLALGLLAMVGCLWNGVVPVTLSAQFQAEARASQLSGRGQVVPLLEAACRADSLDPEPWQLLFLYHLDRWRSSPRWQADSFSAAVAAQSEAIRRDPHAGKRYQLLAQAWAEKYRQSAEPEAFQASRAAYHAAIARYPHYAPLWAELARLLHQAGEPAADEATRALQLDAANREAGHFDKELPANIRAELTEIVSGSPPS